MKSPKPIKVHMRFEGPISQKAFLNASRALLHNYGVFVDTGRTCIYTSAETITADATYCNPGRKLKSALTWYWFKPRGLLRVTVHEDNSVELR